MIEIAIFFMTLFGSNVSYVEQVDYCELNIDHLSVKQQIEMSIGCSTVDGKNVYDDNKLERIYNGNS